MTTEESIKKILIRNDSSELKKFIQKNEIDVNKFTLDLAADEAFNLSLLHAALALNSIDCFRFLLKEVSDLNLADYYETEILFYIIWHIKDSALQAELINLIFTKGMNLDAVTMDPDFEGMTALHILASEYENKTLIRLLISLGANQKIEDLDNKYPYHYARSENIKELLFFSPKDAQKDKLQDVEIVLNDTFVQLEQEHFADKRTRGNIAFDQKGDIVGYKVAVGDLHFYLIDGQMSKGYLRVIGLRKINNHILFFASNSYDDGTSVFPIVNVDGVEYPRAFVSFSDQQLAIKHEAGGKCWYNINQKESEKFDEVLRIKFDDKTMSNVYSAKTNDESFLVHNSRLIAKSNFDFFYDILPNSKVRYAEIDGGKVMIDDEIVNFNYSTIRFYDFHFISDKLFYFFGERDEKTFVNINGVEIGECDSYYCSVNKNGNCVYSKDDEVFYNGVKLDFLADIESVNRALILANNDIIISGEQEDGDVVLIVRNGEVLKKIPFECIADLYVSEDGTICISDYDNFYYINETKISEIKFYDSDEPIKFLNESGSKWVYKGEKKGKFGYITSNGKSDFYKQVSDYTFDPINKKIMFWAIRENTATRIALRV